MGALLVLLAVTACGGFGPPPESPPAVAESGSVSVKPTPTPAPAIPTPTPPLYAPTVAGWPSDAPADSYSGFPAPPHTYAASPSVYEQIYHSDAIVRASLTSATNDVLRFRVLEYLKGIGSSEIMISAPTANRDTQYNFRDAILFLSRPEGAAEGDSGTSGATATVFEFTGNIYDEYRGGFPSGYAINQENRAWMPAINTGGASGSGGSGGTTQFDPGAAAPGRIHEEPLSVADIMASIAWMIADNSELYQHCIRRAVVDEAFFRSYSAYYGEDYHAESDKRMVSGSPAGHVLWFTRIIRGRQYGTYWVEGDDAVYFSHHRLDDDSDPSNRYQAVFATKRPLPAGIYSVTTRSIQGDHLACNYTPEFGGRIDFTIYVTAPEGVVHETLFDPVTLTASVGADSSNGVLKPTGFNVNGTSTSITGLRWEDGTATLSPHVALAGHVLDFIALDGSVALSLPVSSAMEDSAVGTLTWSMAQQPWVAGDLVMLRIRQA